MAPVDEHHDVPIRMHAELPDPNEPNIKEMRAPHF